MQSITMRKHQDLNRLQGLLPEGLLVDAAWLTRYGYSRALRNQYVDHGWLAQPASRVYRRTNRPLSWQQTVISLQTLLEKNLGVGGRTALELHGFAHYLRRETKRVQLYGPRKPRSWLYKLPARVEFVYHNSRRLFRGDSVATLPDPLTPDLSAQPWGQWDWQIVLSSPERAVLELLNELPDRESFHEVDKLMEGLTTISPKKMENLLLNCHNIKVKRLFFFFADRHRHPWLRRINKSKIDLGRGKRMLVRGGTLNATYQITVPKDLDAGQ